MSQAVALEKALAALLLVDLPSGPDFHVRSQCDLHILLLNAVSVLDSSTRLKTSNCCVAIASTIFRHYRDTKSCCCYIFQYSNTFTSFREPTRELRGEIRRLLLKLQVGGLSLYASCQTGAGHLNL